MGVGMPRWRSVRQRRSWAAARQHAVEDNDLEGFGGGAGKP
jgi:hypothetical protein